MRILCALIVAIVATSVSAKAVHTLSAEDARIIDSLISAVSQGFNQIVLPAINNALQDLAAIAAQLTAGVSVGGLDALLGLLGKRSIDLNTKGFWDALLSGLTDVVNQVILPSVSVAVQDLAGLAAQVTAGVAVGGLDALTGLVGKRAAELDRGFWDALVSGLTDVANQVILPAVSASVQDLAAIAAQLTAGVAVGGLDALLGMLGKRAADIDRGFWDQLLSGLSQAAQQIILPALNNSVQDLAAIAAQLTAGVAVGGLDALLGMLGKRSIAELDRGFWQSLLNDVILASINPTIQDLAGLAAQLTAGIAIGGIDAITGMVGKRGVEFDRSFWDALLQGLTGVVNQVILPSVSVAVQDLAGLAAQLTAGVAVGGLDALTGLVGK